MRRPLLAALACLAAALAAPAILAQGGPVPDDRFYLLPQTVYVGDPGRLVLPLDTAFSGAGGLVLDRPEQLPPGGDLVISRVEIENRGGQARLLVDFTSYVPGPVAFPPVKAGPFVFPGIAVNIASILDAGPPENSRVLSPYAPPVPAPGTMGIIYACALGIAALILGGAALGIWGLPWLSRYRRSLKRRRMIRGLLRELKRLRAMLAGNAPDGGPVLDRLNGELRRFLEFFTRRPCASMVPGEFLSLGGPGGEYGPFLSGLFSRCDRLRFGGVPAGGGEALAILDEVQRFAETCEKAEEAGPSGDRASLGEAG
ncbi:MAG: hypothetical protein LBH15_01830 [Treponema sp.]|nr:hypothetical protein [Treponema sp.]